MPTEELLDDAALDRALRELLPPMPRSAAWDRRQRDALLTFVETGEVSGSSRSAGQVGSPVVTFRTSQPVDRRRHVAVVLGIAAAVALLAVGLVVGPRWRGQEIPPATRPVVTAAPTSMAANEPSSEVLFPDRFPIVPDAHPLASQATAMYGGMTTRDGTPVAEALVAIDDGAHLRDAVLLRVYAEVASDMFALQASERVAPAGVEGTVYTEPGSPEIKTFVADGSPPALAVQGLDPVAFIEAAGGVPIDEADIESDGLPTFLVGELPDGYSTVIAPHRPGPGGAVNAQTRVPDGDGGDGTGVWVHRWSPLAAYAIVGDLERMDVRGVAGWQLDRGPGSTVIWPVSDLTWAKVGGAMDIESAVDLARAVEFVDRATWEQRYDVEVDDYPTPEELQPDPSATTAPPFVALEEIGPMPTDVPIGCGSIPPIDQSVGSPVVAPTPEAALATLAGEVGLWRSGWIDLFDEQVNGHRYEYRREDGLLVAVVYVDAIDSGWAVTRWLSTPC